MPAEFGGCIFDAIAVPCHRVGSVATGLLQLYTLTGILDPLTTLAYFTSAHESL